MRRGNPPRAWECAIFLSWFNFPYSQMSLITRILQAFA
jgi:hypothetical protein